MPVMPTSKVNLPQSPKRRGNMEPHIRQSVDASARGGHNKALTEAQEESIDDSKVI